MNFFTINKAFWPHIPPYITWPVQRHDSHTQEIFIYIPGVVDNSHDELRDQGSLARRTQLPPLPCLQLISGQSWRKLGRRDILLNKSKNSISSPWVGGGIFTITLGERQGTAEALGIHG